MSLGVTPAVLPAPPACTRGSDCFNCPCGTHICPADLLLPLPPAVLCVNTALPLQIKQDKSLEKYKGACAGLCDTCIKDCKKSTDKKLSKTCNDALNIAPGTTGDISKCLDLYNSAKDKQKAIGEFASC